MKLRDDWRDTVGQTFLSARPGRQECLPHHCIALLCTSLIVFALARAEDAVSMAELSPAAEMAIEKGLHFLANTQNPDGSWGSQYPMADTSASLMAFMLKG